VIYSGPPVYGGRPERCHEMDTWVIVLLVALAVIAVVLVVGIMTSRSNRGREEARRAEAVAAREEADQVARSAERESARADELAAQARRQHIEAEEREAAAQRLRGEAEDSRGEALRRQSRADELDPDVDGRPDTENGRGVADEGDQRHL
jgi:FtsZ-interacting cell division protein ZipA